MVLLSSLRIFVSIFTVDEHLWSPAARQRTATHCAIEYNACFATPPDCGEGLALERRDSSKASKLVFAEETKAAKKFCRAYNISKKKLELITDCRP